MSPTHLRIERTPEPNAPPFTVTWRIGAAIRRRRVDEIGARAFAEKWGMGWGFDKANCVSMCMTLPIGNPLPTKITATETEEP